MIDYPDLNVRQLFIQRSEGFPIDDIQQIESAYQYAIAPSSKKFDFDAAFNFALNGNTPKRKTSIRTSPLFLTKSSVNHRQYNPTAPENIRRALNDVYAFIESGAMDTLIKAAMCHYQFEMVHPCECYNGIVGRVLLCHLLSKVSIDGGRFISLSVSLYRHREEYFDKLMATQKNGNYSVWISFILNIIIEAAQQSAELVHYYYTQSMRKTESADLGHHGRTNHTQDVYRYFLRTVVSSINHVSGHMKLTFPTISKSVAILQELGILTQISEDSRNRIFAQTGILERLRCIL